MSSGTPHHLRATFEEVPELYDRARPSYPPLLFDDLTALARLSEGAHRALDDATRERLHDRIRRRIDARPEGTVRTTYLATLNVARVGRSRRAAAG